MKEPGLGWMLALVFLMLPIAVLVTWLLNALGLLPQA